MDKWLRKHFGDRYVNIIFTNLFGLLILVFIYVACINLGGTDISNQIGFALTSIIGLLLGWAVAIYFCPFDTEEHSRLVTFGQAASAFVSGYLVSKLDRFIESTLFPVATETVNSWFGVALFLVAFLNALTVVYSNRAYFQEQEKKDAQQIASKIEEDSKNTIEKHITQ